MTVNHSTLSRGLKVATLALVSLPACAAHILTRPMPPVVQQDPTLEKDALRAVRDAEDRLYRKKIIADGDEPLSARIVSGFRVARNEYSGVPTSRGVDMVVIVKMADQSCRWMRVEFTQPNMGGGQYGELRGALMDEQAKMNCPNPDADAPSPITPEQQRQIDAIVATFDGDPAECKSYIREACKREQGANRVEQCKSYADSMKTMSGGVLGGPACKSALSSLQGLTPKY
jgi:hypothetical protein